MLTELNLKKVYSSDEENLLESFYVPVLSNSVFYKRLTGFFSSNTILMASRGIVHLLENNGRIQLISSVILNKVDYEAFSNGVSNRDEILNAAIKFDASDFIDEIEKDHLKVVAWLIASGQLQIKIAILDEKSNSIFHEKIGIFEDKGGNMLSFSGSVNETASGWMHNMEEFKIFRSWQNEEKDYLLKDVEKFDKYWHNDAKKFKVIDLPDAIKNKILIIKPTDEAELAIIKKRIINSETKIPTIKPRPMQEEAIKAWFKNDCNGILAMATGSGKTLTSLEALIRVGKQTNEYCAVIVVPFTHLVTQWREDLDKYFDVPIIECHGGSPKWRSRLTDYLRDYTNGFVDKIIIITTYQTLSSKDFKERLTSNYNKSREYIIIADEVHNFGAPCYSSGMLDLFDKRLGLSATPTRYFDEEGTDLIERFFKQKNEKPIYEYSLNDAIRDGHLTPYDYYPIFVTMTDEETEKYKKISKKIHFDPNDKSVLKNNTYLQMLLIKRAKIIKNSEMKLIELEKLIIKLKEMDKIDHLLIYCDSGGQLEKTKEIVNKQNIISHKFTDAEDKKERGKLKELFNDNTYSCLIAIKCLDEGVNMPTVETAIILASSQNPREYVQRRGRVLRRSPGKQKATIYDFVVLPPVEEHSCKEIFKKELERVKEFLDGANNKILNITEIARIMNMYGVYFN